MATPPIVTAADIATIQRGDDPPQDPSLIIRLTPAGAAKLAAETATPAGKQLAILVQGTLVATPKLQAPLSEEVRITGNANTADRDQLFASLTGGQ